MLDEPAFTARMRGGGADIKSNVVLRGCQCKSVAHQAIVIPGTIDAIRALTRAVGDAGKSIAMRDAALGIAPTLVDGLPKVTCSEVGSPG